MTTTNQPTRRSLLGLTQEELRELLASPARARAAARWLYEGGLADPLPESIPGVSWKLWASVRDAFEARLPTVIARADAEDGTVKYALEARGAPIETVLIPAEGRSTVCVSSQSGCTRACAFCATARLGFRRNLTAADILGQFLIARADAPAAAPLRNVVFMGMGEPMDNLDEVLRAVEILTQNPAPQLAAGHITVSTSGILPGMRRFLRECRANLALSLNGSNDEQRERVMPQNRLWGIDELIGLLREDAVRAPGRLHLIEYVMFEGVNDSDEDAARVVALLQGVRCRVNLIAHNGFSGSPLRPPTPERMRAFRTIIHRSGIRSLVRASRGSDIAAACGQLALKTAGEARG